MLLDVPRAHRRQPAEDRALVQFEPFLWLLAAFSWTHRSEIVERARASWTFVLAGACGSGLLLFLTFGRGLVGG